MADLRMPDLNKVMLAGRLTRDPEARVLPSGMALCKLGLAHSRKFRTKDGEQKEETLFINATCWGKTAEYVRDHFKKGRPVLVEGRLKLDEWDDKTSGQKRSTIEITAERVQSLDWEDRGGAGGSGGSASRGGGRSTSSSAPSDEPLPEDDIPF
jgi:single-strand DNA-binding protein